METTSTQIRAEKNKGSRPTAEEMRLQHIEKKFADRTDRQLLEEQVYLLQVQNKYQESIKNNVQFFFWLTIVGLAIWAIISVVANS